MYYAKEEVVCCNRYVYFRIKKNYIIDLQLWKENIFLFFVRRLPVRRFFSI